MKPLLTIDNRPKLLYRRGLNLKQDAEIPRVLSSLRAT